MSNKAPWFKFFPQVWLSDHRVRALSMSGRGIYLELLCLMWATHDCRLPAKPARLARMVGVTPEEFAATWADLQDPDDPAMVEKDGWVYSPRLAEEKAAWESRAEVNRKNVKQRYDRSTKSDKSNTTRIRTGAKGEEEGEEELIPEESPVGDSSSPTLGTSASSSPPDLEPTEPVAPDSSGPSACPHEEIIALYHEVLPTLRRVKVWTKPRRQALQARWREARERQSLAWWRAYFEAVRGQPFLLRDESRTWCDLEWLISPANMTKVLEGKYRDSVGPPGKVSPVSAKTARNLKSLEQWAQGGGR